MNNIEETVVSALRENENRFTSDMRKAQEAYQRAKDSGLVRPNTYDVPLMSRLSSQYAEGSEKIAASVNL